MMRPAPGVAGGAAGSAVVRGRCPVVSAVGRLYRGEPVTSDELLESVGPLDNMPVRLAVMLGMLGVAADLRSGDRTAAEGLCRRVLTRGTTSDIAITLRVLSSSDVSRVAGLTVMQKAAQGDVGLAKALLHSPSWPHVLPDSSSPLLSEAQLAVLRSAAKGLANKGIADDLCISVNTVKTHLRHIYKALGVDHRSDAVARGRELGLLH